MRGKLALKFIIAYVIFGLGSFLLLALAGDRFFIDSARRSAARELYEEVLVLAEQQSSSYRASRRLDTASLSQLTSATEQRVLILNNSYVVVYDSDPGLALYNTEIAAFDPAESSENTRIGSFYGVFTRPMISAFAPISAGTNRYGYLTLHEPASVADQRANDLLSRAYLFLIVILLISLLIFVLLHITVLKPLKAITDGAAAYAEGNLGYRIGVDSQDEMGYLAGMLNSMAEQLQSTDENQKKFIANVSHDFRSPLTSIRGYLQAMADGVIPPENQEKYMNIIIGETDRLTNLTQSMLSLTSLDEARLGLELSDFNIVQLIRSVCETFEGVCAGRGITFDLVFSAQEITVRADYGRIGQALHNLVDNAIKFSHNDSSIRIRVYEVGEKASISVKDFGVGIARDDLGKIWTRFYKTDASRGKDKRGTGLGLSITKEIISAHGETIDVTSTPGSGTEFIFRLPLAP